MCNWLDTASAQVAIFDATNSTEARRQTLVHPSPRTLHLGTVTDGTATLITM